MPEGDTILRAARTLHRALAGQAVTKFETQLPQLARVDADKPVAGRTVELVEAVGKWMRMYFSGDLILLTHMLMSGSWHIYRLGERWQRPPIDMRVAIHTNDYVAVGFRVPVAEFHTAATLERHRSEQLGPDVLSHDFDEARALELLRSRPDVEIGVALLNQTLVAGLGNVFKSEVCFASRVHPFRLTGSLSEGELRGLMSDARTFMNANVSPRSGDGIVTYFGLRRTTRRCGTAIVSKKQGADARVTFWCPACQSP
jgi:endonuclease-8